MKINRVFCYSQDVAKQNGNKLPIIELILTTILGTIMFVALMLIMEDNFNAILLITLIIVWFGLIIYFSIILGLRLRNKATGYATDTEGRIFKVVYINNGQGLYFGGVAVGGMIDQLVGNNSNRGENLGGTIGAVAQVYSVNKAAEYMSRPEIIAKIVESAPNVTGAEVFEILKIYNIVNKSKEIKVKCDYKILRTNKIKYGKTLTVEKSFNMFNDLVDVLNTHR